MPKNKTTTRANLETERSEVFTGAKTGGANDSTGTRTSNRPKKPSSKAKAAQDNIDAKAANGAASSKPNKKVQQKKIASKSKARKPTKETSANKKPKLSPKASKENKMKQNELANAMEETKQRVVPYESSDEDSEDCQTNDSPTTSDDEGTVQSRDRTY